MEQRERPLQPVRASGIVQVYGHATCSRVALPYPGSGSDVVSAKGISVILFLFFPHEIATGLQADAIGPRGQRFFHCYPPDCTPQPGCLRSSWTPRRFFGDFEGEMSGEVYG